MVATMQRLQTNFKKHGMHALASRLNIAQNLLLKSVVAKALDTRVQLLQRRFPQVHNPISYNAQKLTKDVSSMGDFSPRKPSADFPLSFQCVEALSESNSSLAVELCDLLTSYEMEGLLQAHDSIASLTDRAYCSPHHVSTLPAKVALHQTLSSLSNLSNSTLQNDSKGYSSSTEDIKKVNESWRVTHQLKRVFLS